MEERIYTIPVNEAFESDDGCPFCRLYKKLENDELDLILGASMMEQAQQPHVQYEKPPRHGTYAREPSCRNQKKC